MADTKGYSFGYTEGMLDYQSYRALKSLDFVLPHLRPDMSVLECGSGQGITTFEVAARLTEGSITGIDINSGLIDSCNEKVERAGIKNIGFQTANLLQLPFENESFDLVYMQAILVHIKTPLAALIEVRRVLRKGGIALIKEPIMDRAIFSPDNPLFEESFKLIERTIRSYGGDASIGRRLWPLLKEAGFKEIQMSSSFEQPESLGEWPEFYRGWVNAMEGDVGNIVLKNGWADEKAIEEIKNAWLELADKKTGFAASPWGEAVAGK